MRWYLMISNGKKYKFKRINGLTDVIGYVLFEDNGWFTIKTSDMAAPEMINKQFIHSYKEMEA